MISLAVLSAASLSLVSLVRQFGTVSNAATVTQTAITLRSHIWTAIQNEKAWEKTVADTANASFNCLRTATTCLDATGPLVLRDSMNGVVYDSTVPTNGFKIGGALCNTYDDLDGNDQCPLRMDLSWRAVCTAPCLNPQIKILGIVKFRPKSPDLRVAFNPAKYNIDLFRGSTIGSTAEMCAMLGGTIDVATEKCILSAMDLAKVCTMFAGVFNAATPSCTLDNIAVDICTSLGGTFDAVTKKCSLGIVSLDAMCTSLGGTFNSVTGICALPALPLDGICSTLGGAFDPMTSKCLLPAITLKSVCDSMGGTFDSVTSKCSGAGQVYIVAGTNPVCNSGDADIGRKFNSFPILWGHSGVCGYGSTVCGTGRWLDLNILPSACEVNVGNCDPLCPGMIPALPCTCDAASACYQVIPPISWSQILCVKGP